MISIDTKTKKMYVIRIGRKFSSERLKRYEFCEKRSDRQLYRFRVMNRSMLVTIGYRKYTEFRVWSGVDGT